MLCAFVLFGGKTASTSTLVYDVRAFDAKGDGKTLDTRAINKAIEAAAVLRNVLDFATYQCKGVPETHLDRVDLKKF